MQQINCTADAGSTPASVYESVTSSLNFRLQDARNNLQRAVKQGAWSQLAGLHGTVLALEGALRHINSERRGLASLPAWLALKSAFQANATESDAQRDACLAREAYDQVAAHDGVSTGWLIAARVIGNELKLA